MSNSELPRGEITAASGVDIDREEGSRIMIARAEISNAQGSQGEKNAAKGMNVALIGPNDTHRQIVARALASSQGRKVHEFIDYPDQLNDLPKMFEQNFDFVLVDVDTDESYALQIIEKLSQIGQSVMAYSARSDQELLMACMRAGARDFLPLPTENEPAAKSTEPIRTEQPAVKPAAAPPPIAARPVEPPRVPEAPAARSNVTAILPEKRFEPTPQPWSTRASDGYKDPEIARVIEEVTIPSPEASAAEKAPSEFDAWDAANLRRAPLPPPPGKRAETRPRPALVPERRNPEPAPRPISSFEKPAAPAIERPPVAVELFRSSAILSDSEPDEAAEKQGANWVKWILIAAGPLVLALVLLVVFTRSSSPSSSPNSNKATTASAQDKNETQPVTASNAQPAAKPIAGTTAAKPTATSVNTPTTPIAADSNQPEPVSPDAMAAQLVAPTRIAGQIKKVAPADEPPPSAPPVVPMDDSSAVPGTVFGGSPKVKIDPHVVGISAGVAEGMIIRKTPPVYPKFAQDAHITGKVILKATITKQGTIEGVQVLSGPKILAPAAVDAVRTWKYHPYMLDGQPVSVETNITIVFGSASK
ncbi:TonB family protein [Telmatobacter sp. DSM 110680]|uniref:TonB family protein n=1 Tax=Telmatobacter sp. DSM 110680 TaxID=3036704 RepID=A0AAU7DKL6_9BACT